MSLRLKFGLSEVTRMSVNLDPSVTALVKNALVEGDWVYLSSSSGVTGEPASAGGVQLNVLPVDTTARRLSYPIIVNPQSPENSVPGVGLTVAAEKGFIGYTDRYDPGQTYTLDAGLVAKSFSVSSVTRYGLVPATTTNNTGEVATGKVVAIALGVFNSELVFRYLP